MMRPEPVMNEDPAKCCYFTDGYWCFPFTCKVCDARWNDAKAAGVRPPAINPGFVRKGAGAGGAT